MNLFKRPQHRHRIGQVFGILLVAAVAIGMIAVYMPAFF
jgi:hypothetical protein